MLLADVRQRIRVGSPTPVLRVPPLLGRPGFHRPTRTEARTRWRSARARIVPSSMLVTACGPWVVVTESLDPERDRESDRVGAPGRLSAFQGAGPAGRGFRAPSLPSLALLPSRPVGRRGLEGVRRPHGGVRRARPARCRGSTGSGAPPVRGERALRVPGPRPRAPGGTHDLAIPERDLVEAWEPFALIRARLDSARRDGIEQDLVDPLAALLASLESRVPDLTSELGTGVIHGDMHCRDVHRAARAGDGHVAAPAVWDEREP